MYSCNFQPGGVTIREHLAVSAVGFVGRGQGWMSLLKSDDRQIAILGALPVSTLIEHFAHLSWRDTFEWCRM